MTPVRPMGFRLHWLVLIPIGVLVLCHAAGWLALASVAREAALFVPRTQSAIVLALAIVVARAAAAPRPIRRRITVLVTVAAAVAFVAVPLPRQVAGHSIMPGGSDVSSTRQTFEDRFPVTAGRVYFHSHLGDIVMVAIDRALGASESTPARAYAVLSRLAGFLFLLELLVAAAWHRWSRRVCRYAALCLAAPVSLLFFGYWELGYLSLSAGAVPLLALGRQRPRLGTQASQLIAGGLQGLHTALHGFGVLGVAGGALAALTGGRSRGQRLMNAATFTAAAVALYLGWIFLYVTLGELSLTWSRELGSRPWAETAIIDRRFAAPLLSVAGFAEFGFFSALAGVPLLALAMATVRPALALPAAAFGLPGLLFLFRWWPVSAPFNLDLLLVVFPGVLAACWALASSRRQSWLGLGTLALLHVLLWSAVGSALFDRVWAGGAP